MREDKISNIQVRNIFSNMKNVAHKKVRRRFTFLENIIRMPRDKSMQDYYLRYVKVRDPKEDRILR